jgi:ABC-type multidrug transport system ATPase subunit
MGPSGSGKTTLLNLISGHASVGSFEGSRIINGVPYRKEDYDAIIRHQGYVEQDDKLLFDTLTVWETLAFASLLRIPKEVGTTEKFTRALEILREVGLAEVRSR